MQRADEPSLVRRIGHCVTSRETFSELSANSGATHVPCAREGKATAASRSGHSIAALWPQRRAAQASAQRNPRPRCAKPLKKLYELLGRLTERAIVHDFKVDRKIWGGIGPRNPTRSGFGAFSPASHNALKPECLGHGDPHRRDMRKAVGQLLQHRAREVCHDNGPGPHCITYFCGNSIAQAVSAPGQCERSAVQGFIKLALR